MSRSQPPTRRGGALGDARRIGRSTLFGAAAFAAREVVATARVAMAAGRGWRGAHHAAEEPADDVVVLVHGLMATAGAFFPLQRHLRSLLDVDVAMFTHPPSSSLDDIASLIDRALARSPHARRVHLVGHSLGGIACRWYVQARAHDPRVVQTISVASPFLGTQVADVFPDFLRAVLMPLQPALDRLVAEAPMSLDRIPHLSIVADRDQMVIPTSNAILPGAPSYVLHDTGHNGALFHGRLKEVVAREIVRVARAHAAT